MVNPTDQRNMMKHRVVFAALMSLVTVNIVSVTILLAHRVPASQLFEKWLSSVSIAWPIVLMSILLFAPILLRLTAWIVKQTS